MLVLFISMKFQVDMPSLDFVVYSLYLSMLIYS